MIYLVWSMRYGRNATSNPWGSTGLEWKSSSPPPKDNFDVPPVVTEDPYTYSHEEVEQLG
jgi:cytochrome c oxidase subunit 1